MTTATLILFTGKMGAGKTTESKRVAKRRNAVLISEDEWLSTLYLEQIKTFDDYLHYSARLKPLVKSHVINILNAGSDVVMDFPANTKKQRSALKEIVTACNAQHELIYLKVSDDLCLKHLESRRTEQPERAAFDNESVFRQVNHYFQEPDQSEGFNIRVLECDH